MKTRLALALLALAAIAQAPPQVRIVHADEFTYDGRRHLLTYVGAVEIERGTMRLKSDRLEMRLSDDEKRIREATATGNVEVRDGSRVAWGARGEFSEADGTVILTGAPRLRDGPNELEADTITYLYAERRMRATGNVRGVIHQSVDSPAAPPAP